MIAQTIRVDRVLREAVQTPYADLVTRATGAAVRTSICRAIGERPSQTTVLDFSDVGLVDFSCADEVIAKLLLDPPPETWVVLQGLREEQLEAIEHVLEHHALAALLHDSHGGPPRLVGRVSQEVEAAFWQLHGHGPLSPADLAAVLTWTLEQAEATLAAMLRLRLARPAGAGYAAVTCSS
jgi:hypothetical protein